MALRATIEPMGLTLRKALLTGIFPCVELHILCAALIDIFGQDPKVSIDKADPCSEI